MADDTLILQRFFLRDRLWHTDCEFTIITQFNPADFRLIDLNTLIFEDELIWLDISYLSC